MKKKELIPASSILLVKDTQYGIEVLMVKRSSRPPFSDLYAFPGGKVDESDFNELYFSSIESNKENNFHKSMCNDTKKIAFVIAAIRELFEETNILIPKKNGSSLSSLNKDEIFFELFKNNQLTIDFDKLALLSHWITPAVEPKRFDTRFFIYQVDDNVYPKHDGIEIVESFWITPQEALKKSKCGDMNMILPTINNLKDISRFNSVKELMNEYRSKTWYDFDEILPKIFKENGKWKLLMPGQSGYEKAE